MWTFPTFHHGLGVLNLRGIFVFFWGGGRDQFFGTKRSMDLYPLVI